MALFKLIFINNKTENGMNILCEKGFKILLRELNIFKDDPTIVEMVMFICNQIVQCKYFDSFFNSL